MCYAYMFINHGVVLQPQLIAMQGIFPCAGCQYRRSYLSFDHITVLSHFLFPKPIIWFQRMCYS
jgi:hypothetical protein